MPKLSNSIKIAWALTSFFTKTIQAGHLGLTSLDRQTHYIILWASHLDNPTAFLNGNQFNIHCNLTYNEFRQDEYKYLKATHGEKAIRNCQSIYYIANSVFVCRGYLQPIQPSTENCIASIIKNTHTAIQIRRDIETEEMKSNALSALSMFGRIFGLGVIGIAGTIAAKKTIQTLIKWHNGPTHSERLDKIKYEDNIPNEFICPINHYIMDDPVTACDNINYDRTGITSWFNSQNQKILNSPINPAIQIRLDKLKDNNELKLKIEQFICEKESQYAARRTLYV